MGKDMDGKSKPDAVHTGWNYAILDKDSGSVLLTDGGFETEEDAETQGVMEAKVRGLKNYRVSAFQSHDL